MTDLELLQLLIIFTIFFWIIINIKSKSNFTRGPTVITPYDYNIEKNKIYIYMKDPLLFGLDYTFTEFVKNDSKYFTNTPTYTFTVINIPTTITSSKEDRDAIRKKIDDVVVLQNQIVEDVNDSLKQFKDFYNVTNIYFDQTSNKKIDITQTNKYKSLISGNINDSNIIKCGDFETISVTNIDGSVTTTNPSGLVTTTKIDKTTTKTQLSGYWEIPTAVNLGVVNNYILVQGKKMPFAWNNPLIEMKVFFGYQSFPVPYEGMAGIDSSYRPIARPVFLSPSAAVLWYVNITTSTSSYPLPLPYLQQKIDLKKDIIYKLSYNFLAHNEFDVNIIDANGIIQTITSYIGETLTASSSTSESGLYRWRYNEVIFTSPFTGTVTLQFIKTTTRQQYVNVYMAIDNVVLMPNDVGIKSYYPYNYSETLSDNEVVIMMNGKYKRLNTSVINESNDFSVKNTRRSSILDFINKYYIK